MKGRNYAVALDSTVEAIRDIEYKRGLRVGAAMETPNIDKLLTDGWDLTISKKNDGAFWASVHLGRRSGPDSHHAIRSTLGDAIRYLEAYIDAPDEPVPCASCGAIAGCCKDYPNCPGNTARPASECICPTCGIRHGSSNADGGF